MPSSSLLLLPKLLDPCPRPVAAPSAWKVRLDHLRPGSLSHFSAQMAPSQQGLPCQLYFQLPSALPGTLGSMFLFYQSLPPSVYFAYLLCLLFICTQK